MDYSSLHKPAKYVWTIWKISGLPTFYLHQNKVASKVTYFLFFFIILQIAPAIIFFYSNDFSTLRGIYFFILGIILLLILNITFHINSYMHRHAIGRIFSHLFKVETTLRGILKQEVKFTTKKALRTLIFGEFCFATLANAIVFGRHMTLHDLSLFLCVQVLAYYSYNIYSILLFFLWTICESYSVLINHLKTKSKIEEGRFQQIIKIHNILKGCSRDLHRSFQLPLLFLTFKTFSSILVMCYVSLAYRAGLYSLMGTFYYVFFLALPMCSILYFFDKLTQQSNFLVDTCIELMEKSKTKLTFQYKLVELLILQQECEQSTFFIFGLFPLDRTTISAMIAGIATYVFYLIQFME